MTTWLSQRKGGVLRKPTRETPKPLMGVRIHARNQQFTVYNPKVGRGSLQSGVKAAPAGLP
ncbi:hypothetical protein [Spirosoma agri]|uniref:Uncharacterized protein n=1 Tax=Spirosoma agri TaxID=1987381 RepID=A0A6M0ISQ0_9BACT|nr:hypothetical protein [Spirosoma agri]NEU70685.1 hypothetical protein [Spirosoma agri]